MRIISKRPSNTNAIDEQAIAWVVRLDKETPNSAARSELDRWLGEDIRHLGAFLRAEATWKSFDRLSILASSEFYSASSDEKISRRTVLTLSGGAVALATAAAVGALVWTGNERVLTPVGEIRRVPLGDGSLATVNTNSALDISLKPKIREVVLDKGEAWFDVVSDNNRPFVVAAGDVRVRAVGTAFAVRRRDDGANVLVTEGVVETWTVNDQIRVRRIAAGSKTFVSDVTGPTAVVAASTQIDRSLAWRSGEIVLDGETLEVAAAEFNRYNTRKITIDPALADKHLIGWFHTNEPETFAHAIAMKFGASIIQREDEIHLTLESEP